MNLSEAKKIAEAIQQILTPFCEKDKCLIAGSIRREKPGVGDIEIVAEPLRSIQYDLFQNEIGSTRNQNFVEVVNSLGEIEKGQPATGRYVAIWLPQGIKLDLFIPQPSDFWRQLVIRTGSADFSARIANAWRQKGWVGTDDGLRSDQQCTKKDIGGGKHKWICTASNPVLPPVWESEKAFFQFVGMDWVEPKDRI